ncbi:hypothetical protein ACFVTC_08540 [Streptomyces sp. NPDC057950]|uniref:hypothetical protein n=1 Tax=Streptomyces sp. NPDC057950 TaxID=3346288 RepID=UPI0036E6F72F
MTPDEGKDTATRREVLKGDTEATTAPRTPQNESAPQRGTTAKNEAESTEAESTETGRTEAGRTETGRTEGTEVRGDERSRGREAADTHRDTPDRTAGPGERGTAARTPFPTSSRQTAAPSGATADEHRETPDRAASTTGEHAVTPRTPVPLGSREATTSRETKGSRGTAAPAAGRAGGDSSRESARSGAHEPGTARENGVSGADGTALLSHDACDKYALRMRHAVGGFVDGPRASVEEADHVLEELTAQFTDAMARRRRTLRTSWEKAGADEASDTEQLRLALRDYREVTERLLHL